ncbi:unnamed protein product, partial [Amoebophrya sp. A25]|eukprot:GSA25T00027571001.1
MGGGPPPGAPAAPLHNNGAPPPPGTVPPNHVKMMHAPGATISMLGPAQPHHYGHIYPAPPAVAGGGNPDSSSAFFGSQHLQAPATRSNHLVAMQKAQAQQHASRGGGSGPPGAQAQNMLQHQQAADGGASSISMASSASLPGSTSRGTHTTTPGGGATFSAQPRGLHSSNNAGVLAQISSFVTSSVAESSGTGGSTLSITSSVASSAAGGLALPGGGGGNTMPHPKAPLNRGDSSLQTSASASAMIPEYLQKVLQRLPSLSEGSTQVHNNSVEECFRANIGSLHPNNAKLVLRDLGELATGYSHAWQTPLQQQGCTPTQQRAIKDYHTVVARMLSVQRELSERILRPQTAQDEREHYQLIYRSTGGTSSEIPLTIHASICARANQSRLKKDNT